ELGFLPEAFLNMLAMLGWNPGTEQEIFTIEEITEAFSMDRVHKGGAKFDFEKAKWFNHQWIQKLPIEIYKLRIKDIFQEKGINIIDENYFEKVLELVIERCSLLTDFYEQASYFFSAPATWDEAAVKPKWNDAKDDFFRAFINKINTEQIFDAAIIEIIFKELATEKNIKPGELQLPMRVMLVGAKFGPGVFEIAATIGKEETINRIEKALEIFKQ
ncbi:MAG: glutamate--tRNA ligase, partial [Ferruginibacter sp.]|nr:glutamate--tRNA ligase [Ferruginibacter sp.]